DGAYAIAGCSAAGRPRAKRVGQHHTKPGAVKRSGLRLLLGLLPESGQLVREPRRARLGRAIGTSHLVPLAARAALRGRVGDEPLRRRDPALVEEVLVLLRQVRLRVGGIVPGAVAVELALRRPEGRQQLADLGFDAGGWL